MHIILSCENHEDLWDSLDLVYLKILCVHIGYFSECTEHTNVQNQSSMNLSQWWWLVGLVWFGLVWFGLY